MRNVSLKSLSFREKTGLSILLLIVLVLLPLITLLLPEGVGEYAGRWLIFAIVPAALVCGGVWLGVAHGVCLGYCPAVFLGSFLLGMILGLQSTWQYAIGYASIALAGNLAAHLLYTTRTKK